MPKRSPETSPVTEEGYATTALNLARRHGVDLTRVKTLLGKTDPRPRMGDGAYIWQEQGPVPVNQFTGCFRFLLEHTEPTEVTDLLESEDLRVVCNRLMFMIYLLDPLIPLYSKTEMLQHIVDFLEYLELNEAHLIKTGYPSWRFGSCRWLDWQQSDLYRSKLPGHVTLNHKQTGRIECTYKWVAERLGHPVPHILFLGSPYTLNVRPYGDPTKRWTIDGKELTPTSHEDAPPMIGLSVNHAYMLERGRPAVYSAKVAVLREVKDALVSGEAQDLWERCISILRRTFSKREIHFFSNMDFPPFLKAYSPFLVGANPPGPVCGGLNSLLTMIGYFESDASIGTFSKTRDILGAIYERTSDGEGCFHISESWHNSAARRQMDEAMKVCTSLLAEHHRSRSEFSDRVRQTISETFMDTVSVSAMVPSTKVREATMMLEQVASGVEGLSVGHSKDIATSQAQTTARRGADGMTNLFRRTGSHWEVRFQGIPATAHDSKGMKYLSRILMEPYSTVSALELVEIANKPDADVLRKEPIPHEADADAAGDSREEIYDAEALRQIKKRVAELKEDIAKHTESGDFKKLEAAKEELELLKDHTSREIRGGKSKALPSKIERDRKSVWNAIQRAIKRLHSDHSELATHLSRTVHYDGGFRYTPDSMTRWTVR